jgi:hypothetical protein
MQAHCFGGGSGGGYYAFLLFTAFPPVGIVAAFPLATFIGDFVFVESLPKPLKQRGKTKKACVRETRS